jgi:hypothetical protein
MRFITYHAKHVKINVNFNSLECTDGKIFLYDPSSQIRNMFPAGYTVYLSEFFKVNPLSLFLYNIKYNGNSRKYRDT